MNIQLSPFQESRDQEIESCEVVLVWPRPLPANQMEWNREIVRCGECAHVHRDRVTGVEIMSGLSLFTMFTDIFINIFNLEHVG